MTLPVIFRPEPQTEFDADAGWYEARQLGLGEDFVEEVQKTLDHIVQHPERFAIAARDIREAPVARFPYYIYYRVRADRIKIIAVFHTARNPIIWQRRR